MKKEISLNNNFQVKILGDTDLTYDTNLTYDELDFLTENLFQISFKSFKVKLVYNKNHNIVDILNKINYGIVDIVINCFDDECDKIKMEIQLLKISPIVLYNELNFNIIDNILDMKINNDYVKVELRKTPESVIKINGQKQNLNF